MSDEYKIVWEIEINADSYKDAAELALEIQRDKNSIATYFKVTKTLCNNTKEIFVGAEENNNINININILEKLEKEFPECWFKEGKEFDGNPDRIVWSGEGSTIDRDNAFDYYAEDYKELIYTLGVNNKLVKFVAKFGYHWDCYDPGTYFLFKD